MLFTPPPAAMGTKHLVATSATPVENSSISFSPRSTLTRISSSMELKSRYCSMVSMFPTGLSSKFLLFMNIPLLSKRHRISLLLIIVCPLDEVLQQLKAVELAILGEKLPTQDLARPEPCS